MQNLFGIVTFSVVLVIIILISLKFTSYFFKNLIQPKNVDHRDQLKRAPTSGLQLTTHAEKQSLPEQFVQEVLILSDVLELNEFVCADLLLAGEQQQPNFPGLTRGLVAVLLYHDGRRCLVSALKTLIQSREGITWTMGLNEDLPQLATKFTDELLHEGAYYNPCFLIGGDGRCAWSYEELVACQMSLK